MKTFALIENGIVQNIVVAESYEIADSLNELLVVESTPENTAHIGLGYDGSAFEQPALDPDYVEPALPEGVVL